MARAGAFILPGKVLQPQGTWQTAFTATSSTWTNWSTNYNERTAIPANTFSVTGTPSQVRVTLSNVFHSGAVTFVFSDMYIGHGALTGNSYDFDGTQIRLTFSGSNGASIPFGSSVVSDPGTYAVDKTKVFVFAVYANSGDIDATTTLSGFVSVYKQSTSEVSTSAVTGYTTSAANLNMVTKVELFA